MANNFSSKDTLLYLLQKLKTKFAEKVDKVDGKGLSTNDFTNDDKSKVHAHDNKAILDKITGIVTAANVNDPDNTSDLVNYEAFQAGAQQIINQIPTDTNTTYTLSKSDKTITLTGSDGSTASVTDSDTHQDLSGYAKKTDIPSTLPNSQPLEVYVNGSKSISYDGNTKYSFYVDNATTSASGLMSASDKAKLDGLTDTNTTYSLSKSGTTITLTGSDGATSSVTEDSENFIVTITKSNGTYSADKTFSEIKAAYDLGKRCIVKYTVNSNTTEYSLRNISDNAATFGVLSPYGWYNYFAIDSDGVLYYSMTLESLTFTGASTGTYNGQESLTVNIPKVDTTLAVSGSSADAKTVGDELATLKSRITTLETAIKDVIAIESGGNN